MNVSALDFAACQPDTLILTPNRRLSAWLVRDHDAWKSQQGAGTWSRLDALPLDSWLLRLFEQISLLPLDAAVPRLLGEQQSALLWRQIIERQAERNDVALDTDGFAQLAEQARQLVQRWCLSPAQWQQGDRLEHQQFAQWHRTFRDRLAREQLLDAAALCEWIVSHGAVVRPLLPRQIFLHGFNDPEEPQLQRLTRWLQDGGIDARFTERPASPGRCQVAVFPQVDAQFGSAIQWALRRRQVGQRVGIVIPGLQTRRAQVRQWCQSLWAQQSDARQQHWSDQINISAGQPLAEYPLVAHLLLLLRALESELTLSEWAVLLSSPYFPLDENEWLRRDDFIQFLREKNLRQLTLSRLETRWQQFAGAGATAVWLTRLLGLRSRARQQPLSQWQPWLQQFCRESGWCQGRVLESEEFQVRQRFQETLAELGELDEWLGAISFDQFRRELTDCLRALPFQPQTETAGIQILGVLEAAGLPFDALWLCECEAVNWPEALNPNPLLPRSIQRQLNMPGASPERELAYAERLLTLFRTGAPEVIFSWGERAGETEHRLSSLLQSLPPVPPSFYDECQHRLLEQIQFDQQRHRIEYLPADEQGPALSVAQVEGGSAVLRAQSACPFKAYAEFRLQLKARDDLADGVKAVDRGSLVHQVLELFWREVKDWHRLQVLLARETELDALLNTILDQQMRQFRSTTVLEPEALYRLERERTFHLVKRWLVESDATRNPFQVAQVEKRKSLAIGGIELALTVDRIDAVSDGSQLIIDYKTGDKTAKAWDGERPEEPQLPLYAMLEPDQTRGLLFGVLKPAELGYKGLVDTGVPFGPADAKKVKTPDDWTARMQEWRAVLQQLAENYAQGQAQVDPLDGMVCQYCHLASVCRVKEAADEAD